jgi:hypothetical protein
MAERADEAVIELRADRVANLFDPFDPFPIPSRDISATAEDFIVGWARELPRTAALKIRIHLADSAECERGGPGLAQAIARHFTQRADRMRGDLNELFRVGRFSLLIGVAVLILCLLGGNFAEMILGEGPFTSFFSEGLIILGWVANWRPLEIFLYDWWPIVQRRRLYQRLAAAPIELRPLSGE